MFISVKNRFVNTQYVKEITPYQIIIATANSYNETIQITKEEHKSIIEQLEYPKKMALLEAENKQLKLEIMYRPGGPGFDLAHNDFNSKIN
jgi:hypothetical protein